MKKSLLVIAVLCFITLNPVESQGLLNKVKKAVSKEISSVVGDDNGNGSSKPGPEPACACDDAKLIMDLGKYTVVYGEITICNKDDGSILIYDKVGGKYYISKGGKSEGPYKEGDSEIAGFCSDSKNAMISDFAVSRTKDKFAAIVTKNVLVTEDQSKKMEEAMKNAKSDQERMDIAMKMSQQMQDNMMKDGAASIQPELISNVPGATYDMTTWMGGRLNGTVKFDELLVIAPDRIMDLTGKTVMKLSQNSYNYENMYVNSSNTLYATYNYGTLTFSDNKTLAEVFNPYLIKTDGKVYLTYMYYSPGKDAIMQCAISF